MTFMGQTLGKYMYQKFWYPKANFGGIFPSFPYKNVEGACLLKRGYLLENSKLYMISLLTVRHTSRTGSGSGSRIKRHAGIDYFSIGKFSQDIRVPVFKSARESHFYI